MPRRRSTPASPTYLAAALLLVALGAFLTFAVLVAALMLPQWMSAAPLESPAVVAPLPGPSASPTPDPTATPTPPEAQLNLPPLPPTQTPTPTFTATWTASPTFTATWTASPTPPPTPTVPPVLPDQALITNISGQMQRYTLDCEARSAVDWAAYFGLIVDEMDFQNGLPLSDNPETGFVGSYNDPRGQLPPHSYGVYAAPVAALLRAYGLPAYEQRFYPWDALRAEIAAGRPVIVWVVGNTFNGGTPLFYTAADGQTVPVIPFEHTVIVIGYDAERVTLLDGDQVYQRRLITFLNSWAVLGNQAISAAP